MESQIQNAKSFAGTYRVIDGGASDGTRYTGSADFTAHGLYSHVTAQLDPLGTRHGLAVVFNGRMLIAWGTKDKVEIGAYAISADRMQGIWIPPGATGSDTSACGNEKSVRVDEQTWKIESAHDLEKNPYTGTIQITPVGASVPGEPRIVSILWKLHDGDYNSFGLMGAGWMVSTFNFDKGTRYAISAYEKIKDGWKGVQIWDGEAALSREQLSL